MVGSLIGGYSNGQILADLFSGVVFAGAGFAMSRRSRLARGVTPWRLPSALWAVICFFLSILGMLLELVALATTKGPMNSTAAPLTAYQHPTGAPPFPGSAPAPLAIAGVEPIEPPVAAGPPPPTSDTPGKPALFGWYADVTGRHAERYWDGRGWTSFVRDGGVSATDPLPLDATN